MPHQCLKCGTLFEDGSSQLLKGCPQCGGNRFFYTKDELNDQQREQIKKEVGKDINEQLVDFLGKNPDIMDQTGNWITMKPKDVRKALAHHLPEQKKKQKQKEKTTKTPPRAHDIVSDTYRQKRLDALSRETHSSKKPETIDIEPPGRYTIDVKALLENEPIIIQKDGSYTIHLPSIFKMYQERKEE